jgi:hypothetical protein
VDHHAQGGDESERMVTLLLTTSLATNQSMDIPPDVRSALTLWNTTNTTTIGATTP